MTNLISVPNAPQTAVRKTWRQQKPRTKRLQNYFNQLLAQSHELELEFEKEKEAHAAAKEDDIQRLASENNKLLEQITTERRAHESTKLELSSNKAYKCDRDDAIKKNNDLIESYNLLVTEYLELRIKLNLIKVEISNLQTEKDARLRQLNDYESELDEAWAKMSYAFLRVKNVKEAAP
ncbi:hypothetical protein N7448_001359 [Penicillium atrosanguineum]|uniref:uncharacterized protein n=1 Tax=Penicillium atrosanguineum TaxID=1132637 RepID=UPI002394824F|nr:uncharacterized protein N7443_004757 [Penicillium atrosanguineum]KAJ5149781.1 hypothetical protein N7448_001359 [Penicillium atrosanguineum]KAJ5305097.1 hypothetical protein N7443_004757 [Penicillium atrosanguineum]